VQGVHAQAGIVRHDFHAGVPPVETSLREGVLLERRKELYFVFAREGSDSQIGERVQLDRQSA
jgi:hypothetical protein